MTLYYLINTVDLGSSGVVYAGSQVDSVSDDVTGIEAAGGYLVAASVPDVAAAAVIAQQAKRAGKEPWVCDSIMAGGVAKSQDGAVTGDFGGPLTADELDEHTADAGVTIETVLLKDGAIDAPGVVTADTINEHTADSGVTIEGVLIKDSVITPWAQLRTVSIDATITGSADSNGTACTPINVGAALPARAIILAIEVKVTTPASGGSVATAKLQVGYSGAQAALLKDLDLVAVSAGSYGINASGTAPDKLYPALPPNATQLTLIVTPDVNHKLSALTALAADINVYFAVAF